HPQQIRWSKRMPDTIYFLDGTGQIRMARAGSLAFGEPPRVAFSAKMTIRMDAGFSEMFEQSWRALAEHFYDPKYHGANWNAVRVKYRPRVQHGAPQAEMYTVGQLRMAE